MAKCSECGFLALRNLETRELDEAEESLRKFGSPIGVRRTYASQIEGTPFHTADKLNIYIHESLPICFARSCNFADLFKKFASQNYSAEDSTRIVINEDRSCDSFTKWKQGFSPKEHQEMLDRQWKIEYEARRDTEDKKWREDQEEKAEQRHQEQIKLLKGIHKSEMWIVGGAVTIALLIITLIGAAVEAGWIPKWFGLGN